MKSIRVILRLVSAVVIVIAMLFATALVGVRLLGLRPFRVLSGSMEPIYPEGSLIYIRSTDYRELQVGDAITYRLDKDTVVTHRIIDVLVNEADPHTVRYFTKGDANASRDSDSVSCRDVLGKPVFCIAHLGEAAGFIQSPQGILAAICALCAALPGIFLADSKKSRGLGADKSMHVGNKVKLFFKQFLHNGKSCYNIRESNNNEYGQEV